jgi:hypothetical protein
MKAPSRRKRRLTPSRVVALSVAVVALALGFTSISQAQLTGAVFTTDSSCTGVNVNHFDSKLDVYLDGGPQNSNSNATLPDGDYYVQVTDPSGSPVLGSSVGGANETPISVVNGSFAQCYRVWDLVHSATLDPGYDDTPNNGGEYKVWASTSPDFTNDDSKTDNFQVDVVVPPDPQSTLHVTKFYDANANGAKDLGESDISGWQVNLTGDAGNPFTTPHDFVVTPGTYTVGEGTPTQTNWFHTTNASVTTTVADGDTGNIAFGNVCIGGGTSALTIGYWGNKNGQAAFTAGNLALLNSLSLRNGAGTKVTPFNAYAAFKTWLGGATATNMAYMLSAQLAAMELNVAHNASLGSALIYAPGTVSGGALGFATVNAVMAEAAQDLVIHPNTTASGPARSYQEALKNALDKANNNLNVVQSSPCTFSF